MLLNYCKYLQHSWYICTVLVTCECFCYCARAYFISVNKLYVHVCVLERANIVFFALPNPLSCSVLNKICLNLYNISKGTLNANKCKTIS